MRSRIAGRLFGQEAAPVKIGRFEVAEQIGTGGMGVVHRAYDPKLGRDVAVKVLHDDRVSPKERERMLREAQALAKLNHPNVVQVYEVGEHNDQLFIAMEYVAGRSAKQWQEGGKRPWREVLDVYLQAGEGLAAAHAAGIVHRDFKPANVLIGDDGRVRVADFGLARGSDGSSESVDGPGRSEASGSGGLGSDQLTKTGTVLGTPAYMAPEQLAGEPADERSDQFSFCVSLWEGLTGVRPYSARVLNNAEPQPNRAKRPPGLSRKASTAVLCGLRLNQRQRRQSMRMLLDELDAATRRRTWPILLPLVAVLALPLGWALVTQGRRVDERCSRLVADVSNKWSQTKRRELKRHIEHIAEYGETLWPSIERQLANRVQAWRNAVTAACSDGVPAVPEATFRCLKRSASELNSAISVVATATPRNVSHLHRAIATVQQPATCAQDYYRAASSSLDIDNHQLADKIDEARGDIDLALLLLESGAPDRARAILDDLEPRVLSLDFAPLTAESLIASGRVLAVNGSAQDGLASLDRGVESAQGSGYDRAVASGLVAAAKLAAAIEDVGLANRYLGLAEATITRANLGDCIARRFDEARLAVLREANELTTAASLASGLSKRPARECGNPTSRAKALRLFADILAAKGDQERAEAIYLSVLTEREAALGSEHPVVAEIELSLGLLEREDPAAGLHHTERALAIATTAFGQDSPRLHRYFTAASLALASAGDYSRARDLASRAWALQSVWPVGRAERGSALAVLVEIDVATGDDAALIEHLQTLVREWDAPEHRARLAEACNRLAWHLCRLDRCSEAKPHYERLREVTRPGDILRRFSELGLARVDISEKRYESALVRSTPLLRELENQNRTDLPPDYIAEVKLIHAQAVLAQSPNDPFARNTLEEARSYFETRDQHAQEKEESHPIDGAE